MSNSAWITETERRTLFGLALMGGVGMILGLWRNLEHFWPNLLGAAFYFLTLALGAAVFVAVQHLSNAGWSTVVRRIPEAMMMYLPVGALSLLAVYFGRHFVYEWTNAAVVNSSPILQAKSLFLNVPFFFARMTAFLLLWAILLAYLVKESRQQDIDGLPKHTARSRKYSAVFLVVFAITFSMASFDWIMSVQPEFYSTIFAFYCFSGLFLAGIAALTVLILLLRSRGYVPQVNENHLHNLGKLLLAFSTFWAYIWICQYLLVYYTNLPDETIFYIRQTSTPGWKCLFLLNLLLNWIIPFALLLSRRAKQHARTLTMACAAVLLGHWVDIYIMGASGFSVRIDRGLRSGSRWRF